MKLKIIMLIFVCKTNYVRISNQIENLKKHASLLTEYNIHPIFVTADKELDTKGYNVIQIETIEEKYTNLAQKVMNCFEHLQQTYSFDYLIKIDDDTLFNVDRLDCNIFTHDYIGLFFDHFTDNEIKIHLPNYNLYETIKLYPSIYTNSNFKFAAGNFYVLSNKAVKRVLEHKLVLNACYEENVRVNEDQFIGYCLQKDDITKYDYRYETKETKDQVLQITSNLTSLHPISNFLFQTMIPLSPEEQLKTLIKSASLMYRKVLLEQLKQNLKNVIFNFVNSKKLSGMG